ncbi:MAG: hypothetical protein ACE5EQ_12075 [Phycisphaerae bacterium]
MSSRLIGLSTAAILLGFFLAGCVKPAETKMLNAPPQGYSESRHRLAEFFAYHNDQGMIADMSIADIHFIPHQRQLSGTGEARLERYAELLATSGGTLTYETKLEDDILVEERIKVAREFLAQSIPSNNRIDVVLGVPGGRGMDVAEAATGQAVAKEAEPRGTAYNLSNRAGIGG